MLKGGIRMRDWKKKVLVGGLIAAISVPTVIFAATNDETTDTNTRPRMEIHMRKVPEEVQSLQKQLKAGEITKEEFREKMQEYIPEGKGDRFFGGQKMGIMMFLSEEDRQELMEQLKDGDITKEELEAKIKELIPEEVKELQEQLEAGDIIQEEYREAIKEYLPEGFEKQTFRKIKFRQQKDAEE